MAPAASSGCDAHRGEDMRFRNLAGRAGRAGGDGNPVEIESHQQRFGQQARQREAARVGKPLDVLRQDHNCTFKLRFQMVT